VIRKSVKRSSEEGRRISAHRVTRRRPILLARTVLRGGWRSDAPSLPDIGDFLKSVVYLPFEQSNGEPTLARRRREGDTDGEDTSA
jgi:hypothetical protein